MSTPFVTSDLHFFHKNVVAYCNRPWTIEEQTEQLIQRWNAKVGVNDIVYHLGDFAFVNRKQIQKVLGVLDQLNGDKRFIMGNHDSRTMWREIEQLHLGSIAWVKDYHSMVIDGHKVIMSHYPFASWDRMHHGSFMLHGHCHGSYQGDGKILDVGIDNHPEHQVWSWEEIKAFMDTREIVSVDHHEEGGRE
tara:strand:- start:962 stop:1534 length:573 start_codon:yes stop_codon:yes gene_type:complete